MKREGFTKRPGFFHGVAIAFVLAAISGVTFTALTPVFDGVFLLRFLVTGAAGAYILYLLQRSELRSGRIATMSMWGLTVIAIWIFAPSFGWFVITQTGLIWLVRAGYFYTGLLPALMGLGLICIGIGRGGSRRRTYRQPVSFDVVFFSGAGIVCQAPRRHSVPPHLTRLTQ